MWETQKPADGVYRCSFCGQPQSESASFTRGPGGVCICAECVDVCRETVEQEHQLDFEKLKGVLAARRQQGSL